VYSADASRLLAFVFLSRTLILQLLHIHRTTLDNYIDTDKLFVNNFLFKSAPIVDADNSTPLEQSEFIELCSNLQKAAKVLSAVNTIHPNSISVTATHITDPSSLSFVLPSIRKMANHFGVSKYQMTNLINSGEVFSDHWIFTLT